MHHPDAPLGSDGCQSLLRQEQSETLLLGGIHRQHRICDSHRDIVPLPDQVVLPIGAWHLFDNWNILFAIGRHNSQHCLLQENVGLQCGKDCLAQRPVPTLISCDDGRYTVFHHGDFRYPFSNQVLINSFGDTLRHPRNQKICSFNSILAIHPATAVDDIAGFQALFGKGFGGVQQETRSL